MRATVIATFALSLINLTGCGSSTDATKLQAKIDELQTKVDVFETERATMAKNLKTFDDLDLVAFNNRDMKHIS